MGDLGIMHILNFGSLNIDYVYRVDTFVKPGETKSSRSLYINAGGKGLNQSIASARAGSRVFHAGLIGTDGEFLVNKLIENKVITNLMRSANSVSGHAIIQVDDSGQNCILLYGGTNRMLTEEYVDSTLASFEKDTLVLVQNETNLIDYIIQKAHQRGFLVALNAAPMDVKVLSYPLDLVDWLIINEVEGSQITESKTTSEILPILAHRYIGMNVLLTLGKQGAQCLYQGKVFSIASHDVKAVDTTAAGDTFTGYFLASVLDNLPMGKVLQQATAASALCVQRPGASDSIPLKFEVDLALNNNILPMLEVIE